jgi:hypothetical protein
MKKNLKYILVLLGFSLISCEDVIEVDLATGEERVVIDAEILWLKGTDGAVQTIKISRMTAYYNPETPKVSGAVVQVLNSAGTSFNFIETAPGEYTCTDFIPQLNATYTLHAEVDGQVYTATETMVPVPEIASIEQTQTGGFTGDEPEVAIFFNDPPNQANYYLTSFVTSILPHPQYELNDDELYDGNLVRTDFADDGLAAGDLVQITLRGVSLQFHNYMNLILAANDSNPFATPPANIRGNILNQNSNSTGALGYFRLCEADYTEHIME